MSTAIRSKAMVEAISLLSGGLTKRERLQVKAICVGLDHYDDGVVLHEVCAQLLVHTDMNIRSVGGRVAHHLGNHVRELHTHE